MTRIAANAAPKQNKGIPADGPFPELIAEINAFLANVAKKRPDWQERLFASFRDVESAYQEDNVDALVAATQTFLSLSQAFVCELQRCFDAQNAPRS